MYTTSSSINKTKRVGKNKRNIDENRRYLTYITVILCLTCYFLFYHNLYSVLPRYFQ